jgi:predicted DNA-binding protein
MSESTKPVSIRLGSTLTGMLERMSIREKKSVSDVVRESLEHAIVESGSLRSQIAKNLAKPRQAIKSIQQQINDPQQALSRADYGTLMVLWHQAYLHTTSQIFVDIEYFYVLMDMMGELFTQAQEQHIPLNMQFFRSRMEVRDDDLSDLEAIEWVKSAFKKNRCASAAEGCMRPMAIMSDLLTDFSTKSLESIFTASRIKKLIPLAVWGARETGNIDNALDDSDFAKKLKGLSWDVGSMKFRISSAPFGLIVDGMHHCYAFKPESLLALTKLFEGDNLEVLSVADNPWGFYTRPTLKIQCARIPKTTYIFQEYGGYMLHLSQEEFEQIRSGMNFLGSKNGDANWLSLLESIRNEIGDI